MVYFEAWSAGFVVPRALPAIALQSKLWFEWANPSLPGWRLVLAEMGRWPDDRGLGPSGLGAAVWLLPVVSAGQWAQFVSARATSLVGVEIEVDDVFGGARAHTCTLRRPQRRCFVKAKLFFPP
jgi:hypothetical protein